MSSTAVPENTPALRHPSKNFGFPSFGLFAAIFFFIFFIITPLISFISKYLGGYAIPEGDYYLNGIRTVLALWFIWQVRITGRVRWGLSKRKKYVRKSLIPFLNQKYGITIDPDDAANIMAERPFELRKDIFVQFDGWGYIESEAAHQHFKKDGVDIGQGMTLIMESGYELNHQFKNAPFESSDDVFTIAEDSSMGEPHLVQLAVLNILDNLPAGTEAVFNVINRQGDFIDIPASLQVAVKDDKLKYSPQDLSFFVDAIAANVAKNDSSLLTVALNQNAEDQEDQPHGIVFTTKGFDFIDDKEFNKMFTDESGHLRYNKDYGWHEFIARNK